MASKRKNQLHPYPPGASETGCAYPYCPDPMFFALPNLTPYNFVQNNPIMLWDSTGMLDLWPPDKQIQNGDLKDGKPDITDIILTESLNDNTSLPNELLCSPWDLSQRLSKTYHTVNLQITRDLEQISFSSSEEAAEFIEFKIKSETEMVTDEGDDDAIHGTVNLSSYVIIVYDKKTKETILRSDNNLIPGGTPDFDKGYPNKIYHGWVDNTDNTFDYYSDNGGINTAVELFNGGTILISVTFELWLQIP